MDILFLLPLLCVVLHVFEEFAWPGGFSEWYATVKPDTDVSFTPRYAFIVNGLYIVLAIVLALLGPAWPRGPALWLVIATIGASNAVFHVIWVVKLRRYSPGVITGVFLFFPLFVFGVWYFSIVQKVSVSLIATSLALGVFINAWALIRHRWRAAAIRSGSN